MLLPFLAQRLPPYAQPVFLRLLPAIAVTGTFKPRKVDLVADGFDPARLNEPLYLRTEEGYLPLTQALYEEVQSGERRL